MARRSGITIPELAKLAGVSNITVSRAFRPGFYVQEQTRERILALAEEHGYRVNLQARALKLNRSFTVAVVVQMDQAGDLLPSGPYPLEFLAAISQRLTDAGYSMLLTTPKGKESVAFQAADGIIVVGQGANDRAVAALRPLQVPMVVWGAPHSGVDYCVIGSDNYHGGEISAERLLGLGRRHLAFVGDVRHAEMASRERGFADAIERSGLQLAASIPSPFTFDGGAEAARQLLDGKAPFDGVLLSSDVQAMGFVRALLERGVRVPEDVSVIGYDDTPWAATFSPAITSVHQDWAKGGAALAETVVELIEGRKATSLQLATSLTLRDT